MSVSENSEGPDLTESRDRPSIPEFMASIIVAAITVFLVQSAVLWPVRTDLKALSGNSEFFAYSWVYAMRWEKGEHPFQPHMQLLHVIYAGIDHLFHLTGHNLQEMVAGWHLISLWWPVALMASNIIVIYLTGRRIVLLIDYLISSVIFLIFSDIYFNEMSTGSTAYHSLAITMGICSLLFWKCYQPGSSRANTLTFHILLGFYTAMCAAGKPTFVAFAVPFYVMTSLQAILRRNWVMPLHVVAAVCIAIASYLLFMLWFYQDTGRLMEYFHELRVFAESQAAWYDSEKGSSIFYWFTHYVIGKMGLLPIALIVVSVVAALCAANRLTILAGVTCGLVTGLFFLYNRSQVHAHPEFVALLLASAIGTLRCSNILDTLANYTTRKYPLISSGSTAASVTLLCAYLYPLPFTAPAFTEFMSANDALAMPFLQQSPAGTKTVVAQVFPDVFWGVIDAWCRGSSNIFDNHHSAVIDTVVANATCISGEEPTEINISGYSRLIFLSKAGTPMDDVLASFKRHMPVIFATAHNCRAVKEMYHTGTDINMLSECDIRP